MDIEVKQLLEENLRLSKENNELLLKVYNIQKWGQIIRISYYVILVLVALGALYFIKPFVSDFLNIYGIDPSALDSFMN